MIMRKITLIVLAAILLTGTMLVSCGDGAGDSTSRVFTGTDSDGNSYRLEISEAASRAYNPKTGDSYELTINPGNMKSKGKVVSADGGFELLPTGAAVEESFSVIVADGVMVAIGGEIKLVDGDFTEVFVSFIPHTGTAITGDDTLGYMIGNNVAVTYDPNLDADNLAEAKKGLTFEFVLSLREDPPTGNVMADAIDGNVTLELSPYPNPKATIKSGAPKSEFMQPLKAIFPDVLYYPPENDDVKYFGTEDQPLIYAAIMDGPFTEGERTYYEANNNTIGLACARDKAHIVGIVYVDKPVIMKGAKIESHGGLSIFDADVKKGWNFVFFTYTGANNQNVLFTTSTSLPSSYKYIVADHNYFNN